MKLVIDIGNSLVKVGIFQKKKLLRSKEIKSLNLTEIKMFVGKQKITRSIVSSVKEKDNDVLEVINYYQALFLDEHLPVPVQVNYDTPFSLGKDRLAGVIAASYLYKAKNSLVLDFGTCLTADFINNKKEYIGGRISPGLNMRYKALNQFTSQLPLCQFKEENEFIGSNTVSSINTGVQNGMIAEVKDIINTFRKENSNTVVIFTGGDCFFFEKAFKNSIFAHPFLILNGLNEIIDYNE